MSIQVSSNEVVPQKDSSSSQTSHELSDESSQMCNKRRYNQVDVDLRKELLHAIESQQLSIKSASEQLGINYSTAKNIVRIYRREKRMHKLPKRVNKALEEVLKAWKKPGKKLPRFVAKKCPLFEDKHTESGVNEKDPVGGKKKIVGGDNTGLTQHADPMMGAGSEHIESERKEIPEKPLFNFATYTQLIMESWRRKNVVQPVWVPQTVWYQPIYY